MLRNSYKYKMEYRIHSHVRDPYVYEIRKSIAHLFHYIPPYRRTESTIIVICIDLI